MILGWHCDSNLAARLALYRGRVDTLIDKVFGYHCDHTRVAAANNKGRKTKMNDQDRYIWNVSTPYLPEQAESWGWPDTEIEEIRLDRDTPYERYVAGLDKALEPAPNTIAQTSVDWHLFNDLTYDVPHTLPFVCDQVLTYPKNSTLMLVGARAEFLTRFLAAWRGMGFTGPILVPQECANLPVDQPGIETGRFADLLRRADMFIFEFGLATQRDDEPVRVGRATGPIDQKRLKVVERLFRQAATREDETRPPAAGRRAASSAST